jgi:hypothetical protein
VIKLTKPQILLNTVIYVCLESVIIMIWLMLSNSIWPKVIKLSDLLCKSMYMFDENIYYQIRKYKKYFFHRENLIISLALLQFLTPHTHTHTRPPVPNHLQSNLLSIHILDKHCNLCLDWTNFANHDAKHLNRPKMFIISIPEH